jgi:hypothetical protein
MGKNYYWDATKARFIARAMNGGIKRQLGSFKTEQEAIDAVQKYLNDNHTVMAKKTSTAKKNTPKKSTAPKALLGDVLKYIHNTLINPDTTKRIWGDNITKLCLYAQQDKDDLMKYTIKELGIILEKVDLVPIMADKKLVDDIIMNTMRNKINNSILSNETRKTIYVALHGVSTNLASWQSVKEHGVPLSEATRRYYNDTVKQIKEINEAADDHQQPKGNVKMFIQKYGKDYKWENLVKDYDSFIDDLRYDNSEKSKQQLRDACLMGLYVHHIPRRLEDYFKLQMYRKKPTQHDDKNILVIDGDKATIYVDDFKTRKKVNKSGTGFKDMNKMFIEAIKPQVVSLLNEYIKRWDIKEGEYIFHPVDGKKQDHYTSTAASNNLTAVMKRVYDKNHMGLSLMRHLWGGWFEAHQHKFNNKQKRDIFVKFGDTRTRLPTPYGYALKLDGQENKTVTEIQGEIAAEKEANELAMRDAEEEGSIGDVDMDADVTEIVSPKKGNDDIEALWEQMAALEVQKMRLFAKLLSFK